MLAGTILWWGHAHHKSNPPAEQKSTAPLAQHDTTAQPSFNKQLYSTDQAGSLWWVVNKKRPLSPLQYVPPDLTNVSNNQMMRAEAAIAFTTLLNDAKKTGYNLVAESGYRSYATQVNVYNNEVKTYGQTKADTESAKPGYSEHQTGWAVDIGTPGCFEDCFGKTPAAQWLLANAYKYGFILRYPADKATITGYRNEPWHFRFVGKELSAELHKTGQVMEEFFGLPNTGAP